MANILAVDDEQPILELIKNGLQKDGHMVTGYVSAEQVPLNHLNRYDLIILDIMMPGMDGFSLCEKIRSMVDCPILFLTARGEDEDVLNGLGAGGDDYLTKPFELEELWVRILVQLRHRGNAGGEKELTFKDWTIDPQARILTAGGKAVELTAHELGIVELLMRHPKKVFTRQEIYEAVWQQDAFIEDKTINVHVSNIRAKLRSAGAGDYISTVWGIGFKLTE